MKTKPLILISNDDGIRAEGIQALAVALRRVARVVLVAPDSEQSASSHSLTLHRPLRIVRYAPDAYSINGTPTDCITLAVHTILKKKPDLIVSGINRGANLCDDVHYSGTVSAAIEGALMGIPSIAVSLVVYGEGRAYFETASRFAARLAKKILDDGGYRGERGFSPRLKPTSGFAGVGGQAFVLNVNVPNLPESQVQGYQFTKLGKRNFGDVTVEKLDPRGRKYYWIAGNDKRFHDIPDSDGNLIQKGKIVITPLQVDMTHYTLLENMRTWKV